MKNESKALEATAFHEAGHAVMAFFEHLRVDEISIVENDDSKGRTRHEDPLRNIHLDIDGSNRARLRAEAAIRVALAGPIAQRLHSPKGYRRYHGDFDHRQASEIISDITGSTEEANAYMRLLEIQTKQALGMKWPIVQHLAEALLERRRLSAKEIRTAIRDGYDLAATLDTFAKP